MNEPLMTLSCVGTARAARRFEIPSPERPLAEPRLGSAPAGVAGALLRSGKLQT